MRSKFFLLAIIGFFFCSFTNREFTRFYDVYVQDVVTALTGVPTTPPYNPDDPGVLKFNNQFFTLWLSPTVSSPDDLDTYYGQVCSFCYAHNIRKVIWYIGYNDTSASFYNPVPTESPNFIGLLQTNPLPSYTQIEFLFDCSSMSATVPYTSPTPLETPTYTSSPDYFSHLYSCLSLANDLFINVPDVTLISGVTIDPENNCHGTLTPYSSPVEADQGIVNYMDEFACLNSGFSSLERGMTFDGSSKVQIFGNRSSIPISDDLLKIDTDTISNFYNGQGNGYAPWRPDPDTSPFLDNVYPQLYNITDVITDVGLTPGYIYTLSNSPIQAGTNFLQLLALTPYRPGGGTITFSSSSAEVNGSGTKFTTVITSDNQNSPLAFGDFNLQQCLISGDLSNVCADKVSHVASDLSLTMTAPPSTTQNNVPWLYVENEINYREYGLTSEMINGIFLMFSVEKDFFGGVWTLDQFMNFVTAFWQKGQNSYSPYQNGRDTTIPVPNQFAIFSYEQIISNGWFPAT
jgi:hypothetical protein